MDSAVTFIDDKPVLELAAEEFIFPIRTPDDRHQVLFHVKPYRAYAVKAFYDDVLVRRKTTSRGERVLELPQSDKVVKFVLDHFLSMDGVAGTNGEPPNLEVQKAWLEQNESFAARVFRQGYDAITVPDFAETNGHRPLALFGPPEHDVDSQWTLCRDGLEHRLIVTHIMQRFSKPDHDKYQKAIRVLEHGRESYMQGNWDVVEQLYDAKVKSLKGAVIDEKACDEANRKEWLPLVPFCMKVFVLGQVAQELETKNA